MVAMALERVKRPVRIIYANSRSKQDALRRERQIKGWTRQKKEVLIRDGGAALSGTTRTKRVREGLSL